MYTNNDQEPTRPDDELVGNNALQQFVLLGKSVKGLAAVELIKQVLNHPDVYVFGEFLRIPSIQQLAEDPQHAPYYRLLQLFAYGNYKDYQANNYPPLTPQMINKLRHLTIVSLANDSRIITYDKLLKELDMENLRDVENILIEVIYLNLMKAKMDQRNKWVEIDSTVSRDIKEEQLSSMIFVLSEWCSNCNKVLIDIEQQIHRANQYKRETVQNKLELEQRIANVEQSIKNPTNQELDASMDIINIRSSSRESNPSKPRRILRDLRKGKMSTNE